mgnify:FL=1|tara:strand:- start:3522 stop:4475 length:954 start_codon:yes stop_codon:yes gene_type:complete
MSNFEKILVTGGAGFLGSNLVERLVNEGKEVFVFDNGFRVGFENLNKLKNFTMIKGDITNLDDWKKIPQNVDYVFHLAAINGTKYFYEIPEKVLEVNVKGIMNFCEWLKNSNVKRFFFASSSEVYGYPKKFPTPETENLEIPNPKNPRFSYSSSKMIGETLSINFAKKLNIDYTIGRFHNIYGPHMGFEHVMPEFIRKCVKNEEFTIQGDGLESRSFCYISDAIDALMIFLNNDESSNEIFNIGNEEECTINDLIKLLEKFSDEKIDPKYKEFQDSGTKRRQPDITHLRKLGYTPKIELKDGFKKTYDWYKNHYLSS